jgi:hypothetical protein
MPAEDSGLKQAEIHDLERYLDATRSNLLFARKVILVEGPAELFLIPALLKHVKNRSGPRRYLGHPDLRRTFRAYSGSIRPPFPGESGH